MACQQWHAISFLSIAVIGETVEWLLRGVLGAVWSYGLVALGLAMKSILF